MTCDEKENEIKIDMDDQALKQLALQKEKEWLNVMQER